MVGREQFIVVLGLMRASGNLNRVSVRELQKIAEDNGIPINVQDSIEELVKMGALSMTNNSVRVTAEMRRFLSLSPDQMESVIKELVPNTPDRGPILRALSIQKGSETAAVQNRLRREARENYRASSNVTAEQLRDPGTRQAVLKRDIPNDRALARRVDNPLNLGIEAAATEESIRRTREATSATRNIPKSEADLARGGPGVLKRDVPRGKELALIPRAAKEAPKVASSKGKELALIPKAAKEVAKTGGKTLFKRLAALGLPALVAWTAFDMIVGGARRQSEEATDDAVLTNEIRQAGRAATDLQAMNTGVAASGRISGMFDGGDEVTGLSLGLAGKRLSQSEQARLSSMAQTAGFNEMLLAKALMQ